jgi:hypothetical protein
MARLQLLVTTHKHDIGKEDQKAYTCYWDKSQKFLFLHIVGIKDL